MMLASRLTDFLPTITPLSPSSRDIKPENILLDKSGKHLKVADLGSCRGIYNKQPYTEYISTRWYRAPECLLTDGYYGAEMDIWAAGCVLFEVIALYPLFPGSDEVDQINKIHKILGSPPQQVLTDLVLRGKASAHMKFNFPSQKGAGGIGHLIPHAPPDCVDLLTKSVTYELKDRISATDSIRHPYFSEFRDSQSQPSRQPSRSDAGQCSTSLTETTKHNGATTGSPARTANKSDTGSTSTVLARSQKRELPAKQQNQPSLPPIEKESRNSALAELPPSRVSEEISTADHPPADTFRNNQMSASKSTNGTLSRKRKPDRALRYSTSNSKKGYSSSSSTIPEQQLGRQSIQSKSSLPLRVSQRKSSLPKLGANSSLSEASIRNRRSSHVGKDVGGNQSRRKSDFNSNKKYSQVKSSGYGKSNKIPQNKRYSHIASSGYGQSISSSTHSKSVTAAAKSSVVRGGAGISRSVGAAGSSLPSIGQRNMRARGGVARTGAERVRNRI